MPPAITEKYPAAVYSPDDNNFLFVPSETMWQLHQASLPSAIGKRAGLGRGAFLQLVRHGKRFPWLADWLYTSRVLPPAGEESFSPTPAMSAFREEASMEAIYKATREGPEAGGGEQTVHGMLSGWRRKFNRYDWIEPWLFKGRDLPPNVVSVTALRARRCAVAWHAVSISSSAGINSLTYVGWISRKQIPTLGWLKWLFGAPPPDGCFVVELPLQKLRFEMSQDGVMTVASVGDDMANSDRRGDGRRVFLVQWDEADGLQQRLRACGIRSTVHLDPGTREAYVELWEARPRGVVA